MKMKSLLFVTLATLVLTVESMAQNLPSYVPISGLVAYYPLDGNGNDLSGNNNNLLANGNLLYTQNNIGNSNSACHFPNGNDYFLTPSSSWSLINNFPQGTVSFWVKIDSLFTSGHYFGIGNSFIVKQKDGVVADLFFGMQDGTTKIRMKISGVFPSSSGIDLIGNTSLIPDIWYHVVGTWDGVYHTLYLNSVQDGQINNSSGISDRPLPDYFSIGSNNYGVIGTNPLPSGAYGSMDDIGFWNRALNQQEITDLNNGNNVGLNETSQENILSVFPNPAQNNINLKADKSIVGAFYSIWDITGRIILKGKITSENTQIELNTLSEGTYVLKINEKMNKSFRIIKNQ